MNTNYTIDRYLARHRSVAVLIYAALAVTLVVMTLFALQDIGERRREVAASVETLVRLERRAPSVSPESDWNSDAIPTGSPFLDGQTATVASAALLERITVAVTGAGGQIVSSEVAPHSERSNDAFVRVIANCEIEEGALLNLLYGIEAGMPFLFIDQFVAEAPANEGGRMHLLLGVSGLWLAGK